MHSLVVASLSWQALSTQAPLLSAPSPSFCGAIVGFPRMPWRPNSAVRTMTSTAGNKECRGCHHPRPPNNVVTKALSELGALRRNSRTGCVTCSIILEGVLNCVPLVESLGDEVVHRIDFNVRGTRSLDVCVFPFSKIVSFFTLGGKCGGNVR